MTILVVKQQKEITVRIVVTSTASICVGVELQFLFFKKVQHKGGDIVQSIRSIDTVEDPGTAPLIRCQQKSSK